MKMDLGPSHTHYVTPVFGGDDRGPMNAELKARLRRPMLIGAAIIGVFVVGLGVWASFSSLSSGITAQAEVRVEANRKTLRHREGGTVKQILVKEGQRVRAGQPLLLFNDVEARAAHDVYQNQLDTLMTQSARYTAEATGRSTMVFPPELLARTSDPRVAGMVRDQELLFTTRNQLFDSQNGVLSERQNQIGLQIQGLQAQLASIAEQRRLTNEELAGYQVLNDKGYAPKTLILRYQRSLADLDGKKGGLMSEIARQKQILGETRMQVASLRDQRTSQAAEGLRDTQSKLSDIGPRFAAAKQALESTVVRSPVDGYVFSLTQFTVGGVTAPGEVLMDVVPAGAPMIVSAQIRPEDIEEVHIGQEARVRLSGLNPRFNSPLPAKVVVVSADRITNEKTGVSAYRIDLRIDPKDMAKMERGVHLTPGMPAQALIVTGKRSVMGFLIQPITDTLHDAFREQ